MTLIFPAVAWFIVLFRLKRFITNPADPVIHTYVLAFFIMAVAATLNCVPVANLVDARLGRNSAWLLLNVLFLVGGYCLLRWFSLMFIPQPEPDLQLHIQRAGPLIYLVITVLVMVTSTSLAREDFQNLPKNITDVGRNPLLLLYRVAFLAYVFFFCYTFAHILSHYASLTTNHRFRLRVKIALWGIRAAALYPIIQILGILIYFWFATPQLAAWHNASDTFLMLVAVLLIGASAMPGPVITGIIEAVLHVKKQIAYRKLIGLHRFILDHCPSVALDKPRYPIVDFLDPRDIDYRFSRTLIEILDGRKLLAQYADSSLIKTLSDQVQGQPNADVLLEAALLANAVQRKCCNMFSFDDPVPVFRPVGTPLAAADFYARVNQKLTKGCLS